jgi:hypothetical protein
MFFCFICRTTQPKMVLNVHHVRPQAAGGSDDPSNLRELCQRCHDALHSTELALRNPKRAGTIEDQLATLYPNDTGARVRCLELARHAHHWFRQKREGALAPNPNATDRIQVSLSSSQKVLLKTAAKDAGMSMADYVTTLVVSHLNNKFGQQSRQNLTNMR